METIDIREKLNTYTDVILNRFAEDVFFEIRMLDTWYKEVKRFVDENYLIHKENYEVLAAGEKNHSASGEFSQIQSIENDQCISAL